MRHAAALLLAVLAAAPARAESPLAGLVLADLAGRSWRLSELREAPVLVVLADRKAAAEAHDWGARLTTTPAPLAPWREPGKVTWLAVADLRRVPDYARGSARERLRERDEERSEGERRLASPLLLDWHGTLAERLMASKDEARVVLLAPDGRIVAAFRGAPSDDDVAQLAGAIARVAGP